MLNPQIVGVPLLDGEVMENESVVQSPTPPPVFLKWNPHYMITLGQREGDNIKQVITLSNCLLIQST